MGNDSGLMLPFGFADGNRLALQLQMRRGTQGANGASGPNGRVRVVARLHSEDGDFHTRALIDFVGSCAGVTTLGWIAESAHVRDLVGTVLRMETIRVGAEMVLAVLVLGDLSDAGIAIPEYLSAIFARLGEDGGDAKIRERIIAITSAAAS